VGGRHRAGTRELCRGAQHDDCQRHRAEYRGRPRRRLEPGHLGDHLLCRRRGHHGAADRLVGGALWRGEALLHLRRALWRLLAPLRHVHLTWHAAWHAGAAGYGRWTAAGALPDAVAAHLSQEAVHAGHGTLGDDDTARARGRTGARWMAVRQLLLAVGVLYQRADGVRFRRDRLGLAQALSGSCGYQTGRQDRHAAAHHLGGGAADHAGRGQGQGLVRLDGDPSPCSSGN